MSVSLTNAAFIDSVSRMVANVGVPAVITVLLLYMITPRLDRIGDELARQNTNLAVLQASCAVQTRSLTP